MRLSSSRSTAIIHRPQQDFPLWDKAGTRPSLDLRFAETKSLVDATPNIAVLRNGSTDGTLELTELS